MEEERSDTEGILVGKRRSSLGALSKSKPVTKLKSMFEAKGAAPVPKPKDSGLLNKLKPISASHDASSFSAAVAASFNASASHTISFPAPSDLPPSTPTQPLFSLLQHPPDMDAVPQPSPPISTEDGRISPMHGNDSICDGSEMDARLSKSPGSAGFLKRMGSSLKKALTPKSSSGKQKRPSYAGSETSNISPHPSGQLVLTPHSLPSSASLDLLCRSDQMQPAPQQSPCASVGYEAHSAREDQDWAGDGSVEVPTSRGITSHGKPPLSPQLSPPTGFAADGITPSALASPNETRSIDIPLSVSADASPDQDRGAASADGTRATPEDSFMSAAAADDTDPTSPVNAANGFDASLTTSPTVQEGSAGPPCSPPMREVNMGADVSLQPSSFALPAEASAGSFEATTSVEPEQLVFPSLIGVAGESELSQPSLASQQVDGQAACTATLAAVDAEMDDQGVAAPLDQPVATSPGPSDPSAVGTANAVAGMATAGMDVDMDEALMEAEAVPACEPSFNVTGPAVRQSFGATVGTFDLNDALTSPERTGSPSSPRSPDSTTPTNFGGDVADTCIIGLTPVRPDTVVMNACSETPALSTVAEGSPEAPSTSRSPCTRDGVPMFLEEQSMDVETQMCNAADSVPEAQTDATVPSQGPEQLLAAVADGAADGASSFQPESGFEATQVVESAALNGGAEDACAEAQQPTVDEMDWDDAPTASGAAPTSPVPVVTADVQQQNQHTAIASSPINRLGPIGLASPAAAANGTVLESPASHTPVRAVVEPGASASEGQGSPPVTEQFSAPPCSPPAEGVRLPAPGAPSPAAATSPSQAQPQASPSSRSVLPSAVTASASPVPLSPLSAQSDVAPRPDDMEASATTPGKMTAVVAEQASSLACSSPAADAQSPAPAARSPAAATAPSPVQPQASPSGQSSPISAAASAASPAALSPQSARSDAAAPKRDDVEPSTATPEVIVGGAPVGIDAADAPHGKVVSPEKDVSGAAVNEQRGNDAMVVMQAVSGALQQEAVITAVLPADETPAPALACIEEALATAQATAAVLEAPVLSTAAVAAEPVVEQIAEAAPSAMDVDVDMEDAGAQHGDTPGDNTCTECPAPAMAPPASPSEKVSEVSAEDSKANASQDHDSLAHVDAAAEQADLPNSQPQAEAEVGSDTSDSPCGVAQPSCEMAETDGAPASLVIAAACGSEPLQQLSHVAEELHDLVGCKEDPVADGPSAESATAPSEDVIATCETTILASAESSACATTSSVAEADNNFGAVIATPEPVTIMAETLDATAPLPMVDGPEADEDAAAAVTPESQSAPPSEPVAAQECGDTDAEMMEMDGPAATADVQLQATSSDASAVPCGAEEQQADGSTGLADGGTSAGAPASVAEMDAQVVVPGVSPSTPLEAVTMAEVQSASTQLAEPSASEPAADNLSADAAPAEAIPAPHPLKGLELEDDLVAYGSAVTELSLVDAAIASTATGLAEPPSQPDGTVVNAPSEPICSPTVAPLSPSRLEAAVADDPMMVSPMPLRMLPAPLSSAVADAATPQATPDGGAVLAPASAAHSGGTPGMPTAVSPETAHVGVRAFQLDDVGEAEVVPEPQPMPAVPAPESSVGHAEQEVVPEAHGASDLVLNAPAPLHEPSASWIVGVHSATSAEQPVAMDTEAVTPRSTPVARAKPTVTFKSPVRSPARGGVDVPMADSLEAIEALWGNGDLLAGGGADEAGFGLPLPIPQAACSPVSAAKQGGSARKVAPDVVLQVQRESLDLFSLRNSVAGRVSDSLMVESLDSFEGAAICAKSRAVGFIPMAPLNEANEQEGEEESSSPVAIGSFGGAGGLGATAPPSQASPNVTFTPLPRGSPVSEGMPTPVLQPAGASCSGTPSANKPAAVGSGARSGMQTPVAATPAAPGCQLKAGSSALKAATPQGAVRTNSAPSTALKALAAASAGGTSAGKAPSAKRPTPPPPSHGKPLSTPGPVANGASLMATAGRLPVCALTPGSAVTRPTPTGMAKTFMLSPLVAGTPAARAGLTPRGGLVPSSVAPQSTRVGLLGGQPSLGGLGTGSNLFDTPLILRAAAAPLTDSPFTGDFDLDISAEASKAIAMLGGGEAGDPTAAGAAASYQHTTPAPGGAGRPAATAATPTLSVMETHVQLLTTKLAESEALIHKMQEEHAMLRDQLSTLQFESSMTNDLDMEREARQFLEQELAVVRHRSDSAETELRTVSEKFATLQTSASEKQAAYEAKEADWAREKAELLQAVQQMQAEGDAERSLRQEAEAKLSAAVAKCDEESARYREMQATLGLQAHQLVQVQRARDESEAKFQKAMEQLIAAQTTHKKQVVEYEQKIQQQNTIITQFVELRDRYRQMKQHVADTEQRAQRAEAKAQETATALTTAQVEKSELLRMCNELLTQLEATKAQGRR